MILSGDFAVLQQSLRLLTWPWLAVKAVLQLIVWTVKLPLTMLRLFTKGSARGTGEPVALATEEESPSTIRLSIPHLAHQTSDSYDQVDPAPHTVQADSFQADSFQGNTRQASTVGPEGGDEEDYEAPLKFKVVSPPASVKPAPPIASLAEASNAAIEEHDGPLTEEERQSAVALPIRGPIKVNRPALLPAAKPAAASGELAPRTSCPTWNCSMRPKIFLTNC